MTLQEAPELVRVEGLKQYYPVNRGVLFRRQVGAVRAVDGISFLIRRGETLGLVGESGCGKSSTGRAILQLQRPTAGRVFLDGVELTELKGGALRRMRRRMQMIFQDPYASLNPRMTAGQILSEPLEIHRLARGRRRERVRELMELVGLNPGYADRYPHEFSGGQRQRIGIARALALQPDFIICDEPVSALDVSIQAQVINLLEDLQERFGLTYLFHRPRPEHGPAHQRPGRGHVPGPDRRAGRPGRPLREPPAPVYAGAHLGRSPARSRPGDPPQQDCPEGRSSRPGGPARRLQLLHPLPGCHRPVSPGGPCAAGGSAGSLGGLSFGPHERSMRETTIMKKPIGLAIVLFSVSVAALGEAERSQAETDAIVGIQEKGGLVLEVAQNDPSLDVAFHLASKPAEDGDLASLEQLTNVVNLNLRKAAITDAGLAHVKGLKSLQRLHLEKTAVTDAGLAQLKDLTNLVYLNLYETAVSDAGLQHLKGLSKLRKLFVWKTQVTPAGVDALRQSLPGLEVVSGQELAPDPPEEEKKEKTEKE